MSRIIMSYPTMQDVEAASHTKICEWYRFLASPGMSSIGKEDFEETLKREGAIMDRIVERFREFGGFTPEISKMLEWEQ